MGSNQSCPKVFPLQPALHFVDRPSTRGFLCLARLCEKSFCQEWHPYIHHSQSMLGIHWVWRTGLLDTAQSEMRRNYVPNFDDLLLLLHKGSTNPFQNRLIVQAVKRVTVAVPSCTCHLACPVVTDSLSRNPTYQKQWITTLMAMHPKWVLREECCLLRYCLFSPDPHPLFTPLRIVSRCEVIELIIESRKHFIYSTVSVYRIWFGDSCCISLSLST